MKKIKTHIPMQLKHRTQKGGVGFARLQYVWYPDCLKVDYVNLNDFYANVIAGQVFGTNPTPLNCG